MTGKPFIFPITLDGHLLRFRFAEFFEEQRYSWDTLWHCNAEYELHLVLSGTVTLEVEDTVYSLSASDAIVIASGKYHHPTVTSEPFERLSLSFHVSDEPLLAHLHRTVPVCRVFPFPPLIGDLSRAIYAEYASDDPYRTELLTAYLAALLVPVMRTIDITDSRPEEVPAVSSRTELMDRYFSGHFADKKGEEALASILHLSKRQLARVMEQHYGMTFRQKLILTRMEHAAWLLRTTDQPIGEIAAAVGYESEAAFYRMFSTAFHMTPLAYRKRNTKTDHQIK